MKYLIYIFFFLGCLFSANAQTYNYEYDANGNMTYDGLNGTRIEYNFLNLPRKVIKGSDTIEYIYDAGGTKLATKKNGEFVNYYAGNIIYNGNKEVEYITHDEGLAVKNGNSYEYQYNLTDHLGNVRAVTGQNGNVIQQNDYYPFGLSHSPTVANFDKNKYLYNGKELQNVGGVNLGYYDYGARSYIPEIGIWTQPDPLTEKYYNHSPFSYAANNPVNVIDPNGMDWYSVKEKYTVDGEEKTRTVYKFTDTYRSQKDLDKAGIEGTYLGITHKSDDTYYSLLGESFGLKNSDGSSNLTTEVIENLDNAIIKPYKNKYYESINPYSAEVSSNAVNMQLSEPYNLQNSRVVTSYADSRVMYLNSTEKNKRGAFDWGSRKYGKLTGYFVDFGYGYHAKIINTYTEKQGDILFWTFDNKILFEGTQNKVHKLLNNRTW